LARLGRESSNTLADDLFETLEDWNTYLKLENIDFHELSSNPDSAEAKPDLRENITSPDKSSAKVKAKRAAQRLVP